MKCKIRDDWFVKTDVNGYLVSSWGVKHSTSTIFCNICLAVISCKLKGFQAINQHASSSKHIQNAKIKLNALQLRLTGGPAPAAQADSTTSANATQIVLTCVRDTTIIAELRWVIKCVISNYSFKSSDGVGSLFRSMFTGVPEYFSVAKTKAGYYLTEALGPHFRSELLQDVSNKYFCLQYDETTNSKGAKELQVGIRFWSSSEEQIVAKHLESFFIGSATAEILKEHLLKALENAQLPTSKLIMLASDGPNVNKKVFRLMNQAVKEDGNKGMVELGTCNIHIVNNAFQSGLEEFGSDVSNLVISIKAYFSGWPSRWEDYKKAQEKTGFPFHDFLKHVPSRWLTLSPAAARLLEQWDALRRYFLRDVPTYSGKRYNKIMGTVQYQTISTAVKSDTMKAQVAFVVESGEIFERFSRFFQKEEPLIHVLYEEMHSLVATLMGRVCKAEILLDLKNPDISFSAENLLPLSAIRCGDTADGILRTLKDVISLKFRKNVQEHFITSAKHLLEKSLLVEAGVLKYFKCIAPEARLKPESIHHIIKVARCLPLDIPESVLCDEWKLLQLETTQVNSRGTDGKPLRVDHYWRQIFRIKNAIDEHKYPQLEHLVKVALTLSRGSADVEREFSVSGTILTPQNVQMKVRTLNAKLNVKQALRKFDNRPELVPIPLTLITAARFARSKYQEYLDNQKKEEAEKKLQKKED